MNNKETVYLHKGADQTAQADLRLAQVDLHLCCSHMAKSGFLMTWLINNDSKLMYFSINNYTNFETLRIIWKFALNSQGVLGKCYALRIGVLSHTSYKLWTEICEIMQIFKWDLIKFCEIFTKITLKFPQSSQKLLFICKKLVIKTTKCDLCLFLYKICKMGWTFC